MIIRIDTTSSTPVYAQIIDQIKRAIASGAIRSGDVLPSLRETAVKLRVNPLTVNKAYKQLEHEGLIETRHGLGSFVTASGEALIQGFRRETLAREFDAVIVDAWHMGVTPDELRQIFDERAEAANDGLAQHNIERSSKDEQ